MLILSLIVTFLLLLLILFLFFRALKKISFYEQLIKNFATDFGEEVDFLVNYCKNIKQKDVLLDSPEVRQFISVVKAVENAFEEFLHELENYRERSEEEINEENQRR